MNYSDTYTGTRWTYGSKFRPFLSLFGYFDGWILFSDDVYADNADIWEMDFDRS